MKKTLILIVCAVCLVLCACTPHKSEVPESTPAPSVPNSTPGMTVIGPSETPGEYIDPLDPSDDPVILPVETPVPTPDVTTVPTPDSTPDSSPDATPVPSPDTTPESTGSGIDLPWIPA